MFEHITVNKNEAKFCHRDLLFDFECILLKMSMSHIERLTKLQKRAARIILRTDFNTPSEQLFKELGWSSVPNKIKHNIAVLTYRALNNLIPEYITHLFQPMSQVHSLNLRSSDNGSLA